MADPTNGDRPAARPSMRPQKPESLSQLLDRPLGDEGKVLDALVSGLTTGETTPDLFQKFHEAAVAQERVANLSFAYERVLRDNRVKLLAKPKQAELLLAAAGFFADVFGDIDAGVGYAERAYQIAPDDTRVFDLLETLLAGGQQGGKLASLYAGAAARAEEPAEKLRLLRAAVELFDAFGGTADDLVPLHRQIVVLDPEDRTALETLEKHYVAARRFKDLAELLEETVRPGRPTPERESDEVRLRLIALYRSDLRDPAKAAPHVEALLAKEPIGDAALQAAEALVDHRAAAPRIAPLLSDAYRRLGRLEAEATTLALELKLARPPRLAEVHRRLAILRQDVLGDPSGALELIEPLVARDPGDEELRRRYLEVSTTFHRELEAAKLLGRALSGVKDPAVRARVAPEIAALYVKHGDLRRARGALEPLLEEATDDLTRLTVARRLVELHQDAVEPKGLALALEVVVRLDPELSGRVAAARRLADLVEAASLDRKLAVTAWRALVASPRAEEALERLTVLYEATGDEAGKIELYRLQATRSKNPEEARRFAFQAAELSAARAENRGLAIEAWREFIGRHGPSRDALTRLATLLEQERDFRGLVAALEQLLMHLPEAEHAPVLGRLSRIRMTELRDPLGAIGTLRKVLALDPKEATGRRLVERLLVEGEHRLDASEILEPVYRAERNHAGIAKVLETRAELVQDPKERLAALEEAHAIAEGELEDPSRALEISGRALAIAARARRAELAKWLERFGASAVDAGDAGRRAELLAAATETLPIDDRATATLGREAAEALVAAGELPRAIGTYRRLLAFEPSSPELLGRIDELLAEQGSPEERLSLYRAALDRGDSAARRPDLLRTVARIQQKDLGDLQGATDTLRTLVDENPTDVAAHEALVQAYVAVGDRAALRAELERALGWAEGERRARTMQRLARELQASGESAKALALHRALLASGELPEDALRDAETLAESLGDAATLAAVLELSASRSPDEREQVRCLEKLGDVRAEQLGDARAAIDAWQRGARLARELEGERDRARRLFERVLDAEPSDREAARYLVDAYAEAGTWTKVPGAFAVLLRGEDAQEALELLLSLEAHALSARAIDEFVAVVDEALGGQVHDTTRRARDLLAAKARVLASEPSRRVAAAAIFRALVESYGDPGDAEAFQRFIGLGGSGPETWNDRRWLFAFRRERAADPVPILLEWADAEETLMQDPVAALRIVEEVLGRDPGNRAAQEAQYRLGIARGDPDALVAALRILRERLSSEDAVDVDLRLASLLAPQPGRASEALEVLRPLFDRPPPPALAVSIARSLLDRPESRREAATLLGSAVGEDASEGGEAVLRTLLDGTRGDPELERSRADWYEKLVAFRSADPAGALTVAVEAAEEMPGQSELWDRAERFARRAGDPKTVADAYRRTLGKPLDPDAAEAVGRRFVELHEEWFDEPEEVLGLLERVLELCPRARWALDRIKLSYNAEGRWDDLFALYDRAILGAADDVEKKDLLDEAAVAAKDLAGDTARAVAYLEQLLAIKPDARIESMLERLYERTGKAKELVGLLEKRARTASGADLVRLELRLAKLWLDLAEPGLAFALIERVLSTAPEEKAIYLLLERLVQSAPTPAQVTLGKKGKKKQKPRDVAQEAVHLLEERYRATSDRAGLARALTAALGVEASPKDRARRLEELVGLYSGELADPESAFLHLSSLIEMDPAMPGYREQLADVSGRLGAERRRAELLARVSDGVQDPPTRTHLLREAAEVLTAADPAGAAVLYSRALDVPGIDLAAAAAVSASLEALLSSLGRHGERCDVLERAVLLERDPARRRDALGTIAKVAFDELEDDVRAARTWRRRLDEDPRDLDALSGLVSVLESARRFPELALALTERSGVVGKAEGRADRVRVARLFADEIGDPGTAIERWNALRIDYGPDEESFAALSTLLGGQKRWLELAALLEGAAAAAEDEERRRALLAELGDVCRDRTLEPLRALDAYVAAGDFARAPSVVETVTDRDVVKAVAARLVDHTVVAWREARAGDAGAVADAAHWAIQTLVRRYADDGAWDRVVGEQLRGAGLPFDRTRRRQLRRDAAFTACDRREDPEGAIEILTELFREDPADEIAAASVTRFARLLDEAGRHAELAALWERQAECRSERDDRAGAAALWTRAAEIWEARLGDVGRALTVHKKGASLGGEESLEALARIYETKKSWRGAASVLEWLVAQSTREELGGRSLRLGEAYLALGDWELARVRLEHAADLAMDAGPVRRRLAELYREHAAWEPLTTLLVADADRATDDQKRLALLREAASIHSRQRNDPGAAVPLLERAAEIDGDDPSVRLELADGLSASGRYDEAARVLRAQIERYGHRRPKDRALVHLHLARVSLAAGRRAEALGELDIGAKINPAHAGILYELGRLAFQEGQLARAERTYRALLLVLRKPEGADAPGRAEIYLDLSEIAAQLGEAERAAELVESAFEVALDNAADAHSLERAFERTGRYDLLSRAIEARLGAASDPARAARALSDLVLLHAGHLGGSRSIEERVQGEVGRIHRDLESQGAEDAPAWEALSSVYEWLGDPAAEVKALERRVAALINKGPKGDPAPLLRLATIRLSDPGGLDEGVVLLEHGLDAGADPDRVWEHLSALRASGATHAGALRLMERIAREPGKERALLEVMALRADAEPLSVETLYDAVVLAREAGELDLEKAILRGALAKSASHYAGPEAAWVRETLARLLVGEGERKEAVDLLEEAGGLAERATAGALFLEAARLSSELEDVDRAGRLYRRVLENDPADRNAWEPLLEIYRRAGDHEKLIALIGSTAPLVEAASDRNRLRLEEATLMLAEPGREDQAVALLGEVFRDDPSLAPAAALLGEVLERQGRRGDLIALVAARLDAARASGDGDAARGFSEKLGPLLERDGQTERALGLYQDTLELEPRDREALRAVVRLGEGAANAPTDLAESMERLLAVEEGNAAVLLARRLVDLRTGQGDATGARRALEIAAATSPRSARLREELVSSYLEGGDWASAAQVLERAAEAEPEDLTLLLRAVEAHEHARNLERAVATLGTALARGASDPDLYLERARLLTELGRPDEALGDIQAAHEAGGGRVAALIAALEAAVERTEGEPKARHTLRLVALLDEQGETMQAREQLVRLVKLQPKHKEALRRLASLAAAEARWEEAAATYRRLVPLEEGEARIAAALNLADACEHSGNLADAQGGLERALEAAPGSAEVRARLRQLYEKTGANRDLARLLLAEGRSEPDVGKRAAALFDAAELLERDGSPEEAVQVLEEARRLSPESIRGAVLLARALGALGRGHDATAALEEVVAAHRGRRTRDLSLVYHEMSHIRLEAGNLRAALDALAKAFDLDMRNGELAMQLGHLALDVADEDVAQKAFRSVTMMRLKQVGSTEGASAEAKAVAYYHLSRIAHAQGDVRKARLMASKAVSENPNHAEAQALLKELRTG